MASGDRKMLHLVDDYIYELKELGQKPSAGKIGVLSKMAKAWDAQEPHRSRNSLDAKWVQRWFLALRKRDGEPLEQNTKRTYHSWVTSFIKWGADEDYWKNSAAKFNPGKLSNRRSKPPHWMTADFMRDTWEKQNWYRRGLTAFAALSLARGGEISTLKVRDLDLEARRIDIRRWKTDVHDDRLPMLPELVVEMQMYLAAYAKAIGEPLSGDMYLFPRYGRNWKNEDGWVKPTEKRDRPGIALKAIIVGNLPPEEQNDTRITKGLGGHSFRRSSARALYERLTRVYKEADAMRVVQGMLGHEDVLMTQRYIGLASVRAVRDRVMDDITMFDDRGAIAQVLSLVSDPAATINRDGSIVGGVAVPFDDEEDAA
jgi:integrase